MLAHYLIESLKKIPVTMDCSFTLDNLDEAELVETDEGIAVENEHGTIFPLVDLSLDELMVAASLCGIQVFDYLFSITVSHYDDEGDVLQSFVEKYNTDPKIAYTEVSVQEQTHISGVLTFGIRTKKGTTIVNQISELISEYSLTGECYSLYGENGEVIFTEEDVDII